MTYGRSQLLARDRCPGQEDSDIPTSVSRILRLWVGNAHLTSRMRLAGKICCACRASLDPDPTHPNCERYCARCAPRHRIYMQFMHDKGGRSVSFLEEDCKTSLPCKFVFQSEMKIIDLARHGGAEFNLTGRQAIDQGIAMGRGAVWLSLTREQYAKLNRRRQ